ncbi:esterase/lipase family protein [Pseudonocardia broussonetiae]|uniref:Lipase n=1 Tax=Pseudonocardia broussonetiae TaxID=2736640 RepID=A0A6M6JJV9_9PSEU|nr:alpha/beta fold hydrolase [Pseudonocardia broussonetiae]QJY48338.1 lipase [Pseudonocardia broussonetiae]
MGRGQRARWVGGAALVAALVAGLAVVPASAQEADLPVPYGALATLAAEAAAPGSSPPGSNDDDCEPTAEHPDPVVLVHGLGANRTVNWQTMSPLLANEGYCVFALTYGTALAGEQVGGLRPMEQSAEELAAFVDGVLAATGAERVDLVGHSEGTLMPQYWLQFLGGNEVVDDYVAVTPLYDGTLADPLPVDALVDALGVRDAAGAPVALACGSCPQFVSGSDYLDRMAAAGTRVEGIDYTTVMTRYDQLVVPYTSGVLEGATNIVVQDGCEIDFSDHLSIIFSERTGQIILNALDPEDAQDLPCRPVAPLLGNELISVK